MPADPNAVASNREITSGRVGAVCLFVAILADRYQPNSSFAAIVAAVMIAVTISLAYQALFLSFADIVYRLDALSSSIRLIHSMAAERLDHAKRRRLGARGPLEGG